MEREARGRGVSLSAPAGLGNQVGQTKKNGMKGKILVSSSDLKEDAWLSMSNTTVLVRQGQEASRPVHEKKRKDPI